MKFADDLHKQLFQLKSQFVGFHLNVFPEITINILNNKE